jgi:hypothetical protein
MNDQQLERLSGRARHRHRHEGSAPRRNSPIDVPFSPDNSRRLLAADGGPQPPAMGRRWRTPTCARHGTRRRAYLAAMDAGSARWKAAAGGRWRRPFSSACGRASPARNRSCAGSASCAAGCNAARRATASRRSTTGVRVGYGGGAVHSPYPGRGKSAPADHRADRGVHQPTRPILVPPDPSTKRPSRCRCRPPSRNYAKPLNPHGDKTMPRFFKPLGGFPTSRPPRPCASATTATRTCSARTARKSARLRRRRPAVDAELHDREMENLVKGGSWVEVESADADPGERPMSPNAAPIPQQSHAGGQPVTSAPKKTGAVDPPPVVGGDPKPPTTPSPRARSNRQWHQPSPSRSPAQA